MTTPTPTTDPVEELLRVLVQKDDAREEKEDARAAVLKRVETALTEMKDEEEARAAALKRIETGLTEMKAEQTRTTTALREVRSELQRQDQQIQLFDQRIHGNYVGIASRLDDLDQDLKHGNTFISNLETAVVDVTRASRTLHGRMIEESDIGGKRLKGVEDGLEITQKDVTGLDKRMGGAESGIKALQKRMAMTETPGMESVAQAAGGGTGGG